MVLDRARDILATFEVSMAGDVIANPGVQNGVLVPLYIERDKSGRQRPSGRLLSQITDELRASGIVAEFLMIDETAQKMEEGLRASLIGSFPSVVRNSFLSVVRGQALGWIDTNHAPTEEERRRISEHVARYVGLFGIDKSQININSESNLPTNTEVLRAVRLRAPANCESVCQELERQGFEVPSLSWVNHRFDALRKAGLVVRMPERKYALTFEALHRMGTIKNRRSPDIVRLLALARSGG